MPHFCFRSAMCVRDWARAHLGWAPARVFGSFAAPQVLAVLLAGGANPNAVDTLRGEAPLHWAAWRGRLCTVAALLQGSRREARPLLRAASLSFGSAIVYIALIIVKLCSAIVKPHVPCVLCASVCLRAFSFYLGYFLVLSNRRRRRKRQDRRGRHGIAPGSSKGRGGDLPLKPT